MATHPLPTVAETLAHPSYPTVTWSLRPSKSGYLPIAANRGGPFKVHWELHGTGPCRLILIMGLGSLKSAWQRQTHYFGHERGDAYSVLIIDNRGMGDSDKPFLRYSTSEMALDVLEVLTHVGWLEGTGRTFNLVGLSMGGMIAQELACRIPGRISTLTLCCTAAAIENTTTFAENLISRVSMLVPKSLENSVRDTGFQLFAESWLRAPDDARLPTPGTLGVDPPEGNGGVYGKFECNYQRFLAGELQKRNDPVRFSRKGFYMQIVAAGWHHKSAKQLAEMADGIGRERIMILHGTDDQMISVPHGKKLIEYIRPGKSVIEEGLGHVPILERTQWFNELIEERLKLGEKLDGR